MLGHPVIFLLQIEFLNTALKIIEQNVRQGLLWPRLISCIRKIALQQQ